MLPERAEGQSEVKFLKIKSARHLQDTLKEHGIDLFLWGESGKTKTVAALFKEIKRGETRIFVDNDGRLVRLVNKVAVDVTYRYDDEVKLRLHEEFLGKEGWFKRKVGKSLKRGVIEKMLPGENPFVSAIRGLKEEMKIKRKELKSADLEGLIYLSGSAETRHSRGFPGLITAYSYHDFIFELPSRFFRPEGYNIRESGFKTRLVWEKIV